jgi:ribonuclease Z
VAQGLPHTFKAKTFLITHAHLDHASGIPYLISQKTLLKMKPATFYMPSAMMPSMKNIMHEWEKIDGHTYSFEFAEAKVGEEIELTPHCFFKPFKTFHRVPSVGYTIFEKRKKLKPEFADKKDREFVKMKNEGVEFTDMVKTPIFAYTGDTKIEFWEENPEVLQSKILFVEVTYLDQKKTVNDAREWGHIHLDEILPLLPEFKGEKLVFTHISSRYQGKFTQQVLQEKIPKEFHSKVDFFPRGLATN